VDRLRLLPLLVHGEHHAAVHQLFVDLDRCRRQEDHEGQLGAQCLQDAMA